MIYYFLILFYWLFFYAFGKKKITNTRLFFAILPLFLIMALKSVSVGSDTISYYNRYVGAVEMLSAANAITEPGYKLFLPRYFKCAIWGVQCANVPVHMLCAGTVSQTFLYQYLSESVFLYEHRYVYNVDVGPTSDASYFHMYGTCDLGQSQRRKRERDA